MKTKYTDKIQAFVDDEITEDEFFTWYEAKPYLEHPDIMRELKQLMEVKQNINGAENEDFIAFSNAIDAQEELILSSVLEDNLQAIEFAEQDKQKEAFKVQMNGWRKRVIYSLETTSGDKEKLKSLALHLIEIEKKLKFYDADNWKDVLWML